MTTKVTHSDQMRFMIEQRMIRMELHNLLGEKQSDFKKCTQLQKELYELKSDFVSKNHEIYTCTLKDLVAQTDRKLSHLIMECDRRKDSEQPVDKSILRELDEIRTLNQIRKAMCNGYHCIVNQMDDEEAFNEARLDLIVEIASIWIYNQTEEDARKNEEREKEGKKKKMKKPLQDYVDDLLKKLGSKDNVELNPMEKSLKDLFEKTYIQIQELQCSIKQMRAKLQRFYAAATRYLPPSESDDEL
ncbi:uncharacterized protein LOC106654922 [Trichogramma pretiosum]|uniref:uncharacterized protein LOC106654922 n=1 Tax=Trichogramma pretiosum TaxID=7493 RepID=UPI0006C9600E|nr:uncharacterized protein LOC106654922 [Trichogramma pretiosum]